jgi:4-amino-4-deoxy-L-arabinose transferase-like glycosyltransferase
MWTSLTQFARQQTLWLILVSGLVGRLIIAKFLPPGFDEAYYFLYTLNPDWSYFDHPPLVAGTTALGIGLLGGNISALSIRLGGVLIYTLTLYLLYFVGARLFHKQVGILAVAIASIVPIFQVAFGSMTLPDGPLMLFWVASLAVAVTEFFPPHDKPYRPTRRLAILGFLVGLACLGKYHGFLLGAGYVGFCLTSPPHRRALYSPWTIVSLGLFAIVLFPMIYWNMQHDWASFTFQAERSVPARSFEWRQFGLVVMRQMGFLFPTIAIPLTWVTLKTLIQQLWRIPFGDPNLPQHDPTARQEYLTRQRQRRLILWVSAPVFIGFTLIGGYRQIFPTWAMPGGFTAVLLLAERASQLRWRIIQRWLIGSLAIVQVLLLIALSHVTWGTFQNPSQNKIFGLLPADVTQDGSIELIDIEQLRRGFAAQPQLMAALQGSDFVYTNRFHLSGHVGMALTPLDRKPITCFDKRDMRGFAFWSTAKQWLGKTGLYLTTDRLQAEENPTTEYGPYFQSWKPIGEVPLYRGGVLVDRIHVYRGEQLVKAFPRPERATNGA